MMLLCDGDPARKNRAFALNPDVKYGAFNSTEVSHGALSRVSTAHKHGPIGVFSMLSHFYPVLGEPRVVEFQGPVERRRRPMPKAMAEVYAKASRKPAARPNTLRQPAHMPLPSLPPSLPTLHRCLRRSRAMRHVTSLSPPSRRASISRSIIR